MRRERYRILALGTLLGMLIVLGVIGEAAARVDININIGAPPPFVLSAPPEVAVIPGTYVYAVPGIAVDILFFHGYWYRPYEGQWHRSQSYNGPWVRLEPRSVPHALISLPPDYRRVPPGHLRIPHGQLKKNWGRWEHEQHWAQDRDWRGGGRERGEDRADVRGREGRDFEDHGRGHEGHGRGH